MGAYHLLVVERRYPRCGATAEMEVEFKFGVLTDMDTYRLGDAIHWGEPGLRFPTHQVFTDEVVREATALRLCAIDVDGTLSIDALTQCVAWPRASA